MERIPNELWNSIVSLVPKDDLCNCRLVCKSWADFAGHQLFQIIHFGIFPHYLERLRNIAAHPRLRTFVRRLIVDGGVFDEKLLKHNTWIRSVDREAKSAVQKRFCIEAGLSETVIPSLHARWSWRKHLYGFYHRMVEMVMVQLDFFEQGLGIEHLRNTIQQLPNLKEIGYVRLKTVTFASEWNDLDLHVPASRQIDGRSMVTGIHLDGLPVTKNILEKTLIDLRTINGMSSNPSSHMQPLALLLSALDYPGSSGLQKLVWREMPRRFFHDDSTDGWSSIMSLADSLQNLREMNLQVPFFSVVYGDPVSHGSLSRLLQLIQKAPCLDTLYLDFVTYENNRGSPSSYEMNDVSELLKGITLSQLSNLRLSTCQFSEGIIIDLLIRHSRVLRSLHLEDAKLVFNGEQVGLWKEVMRRIAAKMSLVHVHLIKLQDMEILKMLPSIRGTYDPDDLHGPNTPYEVGPDEPYERGQPYANAIARFLLYRGQVKYPEYSMLRDNLRGDSSESEESN